MAPSTGDVTETPQVVAANKRTVERTEKARIVKVDEGGKKEGGGKE
jgi:hypothetical protein